MRPKIKVYKLSWFSNIHDKKMEKLFYSREDYTATIDDADHNNVKLHPSLAASNVYFRQVDLLTPEEFWSMCDERAEMREAKHLGPDMGDISIM